MGRYLHCVTLATIVVGVLAGCASGLDRVRRGEVAGYETVQARYDRLDGKSLAALEEKLGLTARPMRKDEPPPRWLIQATLDGLATVGWAMYRPPPGSRTVIFDLSTEGVSAAISPQKAIAWNQWAIEQMSLQTMAAQGIVPVNPVLLGAPPPIITDSDVQVWRSTKYCRFFVVVDAEGTIIEARAEDVNVWKSTTFSDYTEKTGCADKIDGVLSRAGV